MAANMFKKTELELPEVWLIEPTTFKDERGFFREIGRQNAFEELGLPNFVQENHSRSVKNVVRGLHYQESPKQVAKLVRCVRGEIFDVAVDIRPNSNTYGKWVGQYLSGTSGQMLYVPEGFAHGFCVISEWADVIYNVTDYYSPEHDRAIRFDDENIGINWPAEELKASDKDRNAPLLNKKEGQNGTKV